MLLGKPPCKYFSFDPMPPLQAIWPIYWYLKMWFSGTSGVPAFGSTPDTPTVPGKSKGILSCFCPVPPTYPEPGDTVKINLLIHRLCLLDKMYLGVGGHARQRRHTFSRTTFFIYSLYFRMERLFLHTYKIYIFTVKYSNIEKHKSQWPIAAPSNNIT